MEKLEFFGVLLEKYQEELLLDPRDARDGLITIFKHCLHRGNRAEAFLVWPVLIKAIILSWDDFHLLDEYLRWYQENQIPASFLLIPDIRASLLGAYFAALVFRKPEAGELPLLEQELFLALKECQRESVRVDGLFFLSLRAFWQGDLGFLDQIIDEFGRESEQVASYSSLITGWIRAGKNIWVHFDLKKAEAELTKACKLARQKGLSLWNHILWALGVVCALVGEDHWEASRRLAQMESSLMQTGRHARSQFFHLAAWIAFVRKDFNKAELALKRALQIASETGYLYPCYLLRFALAQIFFKKGALPKALATLKECETFAQKTRSRILIFMCLLFRAYLAYLSGDRLFGKHFLSRAIRLGNRENYFNLLWWWNREMMAYLFGQALEEGLHGDYVRQFILKHHLTPPSIFRVVKNWPYPVRIHTLGGLEISVDENRLSFSRKSPARPIALLLALITAGGELAKERLLDLFWSEQEGDAAYHALETTLYRLRKILRKDVVLNKERQIVLKKDLLYVDLWDLRDKLKHLEKALSEKRLTKSFFLAEDILTLYREFLPGFSYSFVLFEREWLKSRMVSLLQQTAGLIERDFPEKGVLLYEKAWMVDPGDEKACELLIKALIQNDRLEEACKAYYLLTAYLKAYFQREPSPRLKRLALEIEAKLKRHCA